MYEFTKESYNKLEGSGIYIFYHNEVPIYVGQTKDFKKRLYQHYYQTFSNKSPRPLYEYLRNYKDEITFDVYPTEERDEEERRLIDELNPKFNVQWKKNSMVDWLEGYEGKEYTIKSIIEQDGMKYLRAARRVLSPNAFVLFFEFMNYKDGFTFEKEKILTETRLTPQEVCFAMEELEKKNFICGDVLYLVSAHKAEQKPKRKLSQEEKDKNAQLRAEEKERRFRELIDEYVGVRLAPDVKEELLLRSKEFIRTSGDRDLTMRKLFNRVRESGYQIKMRQVSKKDGLPKELYKTHIYTILPRSDSQKLPFTEG